MNANSKHAPLSFGGSSYSHEQSQDFKSWVSMATAGDKCLSNLYILPLGTLSTDGNSAGTGESTGMHRMSIEEQAKLATSLEDKMDAISMSFDHVSLGESKEDDHKMPLPKVDMVIDDPEDVIWKHPDTFALSVQVKVKADKDADEPVRTYYRVIPVKKDEISERVKKLRTSIEGGCSGASSGVDERDCRSVSVVSLLESTLTELDKQTKKRQTHIDVSFKRVPISFASPRHPKFVNTQEAFKAASAALQALKEVRNGVSEHFPGKQSSDREELA
jgi:hypothetical protein